MSNETDDFLEHYGVRGMKWGKRRGGLRSRVKSASLDFNQRQTSIANRAVKGNQTREERIISAPAKLIMGKKTYQKRMQNSLGELKAQKKRIESGKMTIADKINVYNSISMADLVVSRRDNKG